MHRSTQKRGSIWCAFRSSPLTTAARPKTMIEMRILGLLRPAQSRERRWHSPSSLRSIRLLRLLIFALLATGLDASAEEVRIVRDLPYRLANEPNDYAKSRCKLDLYLPASGTEFPCVVWFHGGGLESGGKDSERQWGSSLAKAGIAMAAVDYRLSPKVQYPVYIQDAAAAVAWVHTHIAQYGGEPRSVFVSGHSAGGYLAAMVAIDKRWLTAAGIDTDLLAGTLPVSGQMITHSTVRKERGIPRSTEIVDEAAPLTHVRPGAPPMLLITGDHDLAERSDENRRMHEALAKTGCDTSRFREFKDRDHGSIKDRMLNQDDPARIAFVAFIMQHRMR
ncbi:Carboxylesterase NlhH [Planctomycetes bacterium CA13]|uniref:Carboxylesterase NlhH n=1 Tax=Novipirellula herctigrandis TaxID=2527986 RepID=A0A5C5YXV2_9BACT|nr:Carboxylesterase NlhH [Planctomycetes bacterium CA13]